MKSGGEGIKNVDASVWFHSSFGQINRIFVFETRVNPACLIFDWGRFVVGPRVQHELF